MDKLEQVFEIELKLGVFEKPISTLTLNEDFIGPNGVLNEEGLEEFGKFKWKDYFWKCEVEECLLEINDLDVLREHYEEVHESPIKYNCNECPKSFPKLTAFINHVHLHKPNLKFCCIFCSDFFWDSINLHKHQFKEHEKIYKYLPCIYCSHVFSKISLLRNHKNVHFNNKGTEPKFICDLCDKKFHSKKTLKGHITRHMKDEIYICDICGQKVFDRTSLKRHQLIKHVQKTPFECEMCQEKFKTLNQLSVHIISHNQEKKKLSCDVCSKKFNYPNRLKSHFRTHTLEKPFECEFCEKRFRFNGSLMDHQRLHTGERPYACPNCDRTFPNWQNYNKHIKNTKHYKCDSCEKSFNAKHKLRSHVDAEHKGGEFIKEIVEYVCGVCDKIFAKMCSLKSHLIVHSDKKPFKCNYCFETFKAKKGLSKHIKSHVEVQEFRCDVCQRYFSRKTLWKKHRETYHQSLEANIE